jgi:putative membrane protein
MVKTATVGTRLQAIFSESDLDCITAAVGNAEADTSGEIAVVIVPHSRFWFRDGWLQAALCASIAGAGYLLLSRYDNWGEFYLFLQATKVGASVFGLALVFFSWWSFRPAQITANCRRNALGHFARLSPTRAQTAVLILISVAEERAVIIADRGIAEKLPADYWHIPQAAIAHALQEGRPTDGLVAAVAEIGGQLAHHFPRSDDDKNELPDRPRIG